MFFRGNNSEDEAIESVLEEKVVIISIVSVDAAAKRLLLHCHVTLPVVINCIKFLYNWNCVLLRVPVC